MRDRLLMSVLAVAIASLALAASASAGATNSNSPNDFVVGGGQNNPPEPSPINHFAVNGKSDSDGSNPFGEAHFTATVVDPNKKFQGDVVCLNVVGNRAIVVFTFTHTKNQPPAFQDGWDIMYVEDNGEPNGGQSPDFVANDLHPSTDPVADCHTAIFRRALNPLSSGNIQVHDG
jgi:hypothetical protein